MAFSRAEEVSICISFLELMLKLKPSDMGQCERPALAKILMGWNRTYLILNVTDSIVRSCLRSYRYAQLEDFDFDNW